MNTEQSRHRAIIDAERRRAEETEAACRGRAEEIVALMRRALVEWDEDAESRRLGVLRVDGIASLLSEFEEAWQRRAIAAFAAAGASEASDAFTREERQVITASRMYGLPFGETR